MFVKLLDFGRLLVAAGVILGASLSGMSAQAQGKPIRLRNERFSTPSKPPTSGVQPQAFSPAVSGLHLIQFEGPLQRAWRDQLRAQRIELIRAVPEDAFVARFEAVSVDRIQSLPYVRWIGPYRPEHKVDSRSVGKGPAAVNVLLSPLVTGSELVAARRGVLRLEGISRSRFGTVLRATVTTEQLSALARSDAVLWIEPAPRMKLYDEIASKIVGGDDGANGTRTVTQQLGFDGTGVSVAVADSGLNNGDAASMHPDLFGRVDAFFFYGTNLVDAADEHSHGTHCTGIIAGDAAAGESDENGFLYGLGVAPEAHIVAQRIFDGVGNYEAPPSFERLTRDAVRAGAHIGSNSWGDDTQGRYDLSAAEFDALVRDADAGTPGDQPYILEFSAGNAGPGSQTIGSPAVAKNVIATGAAQNNRFDFFIYTDGQEAMADFSSRGPCEDGRIKPDVVAPGTWIASLKSFSATDENAWAAISENYLYQGGTSQAGPHVSGAAAVFVQYYRETHSNTTPSPALVKAALINSAADLDDSFGTDPVPNNEEGWGSVDLTALIGSSRRYDFLDQSISLSSGQTYTHRVVVASSSEPLKLTLAYSDVPGFPAAIPALVNNLDLEVEAPDGQIYRGNQFDGGESVPGALAADNVNNIEAVHLAEPLPGEYLVRIRARNVAEDARIDTPAIDQDFALVASGDLPLPGVGVLFFNRGAYTVPSQIGLKLIDLDLTAQPSVSVRLSSTTETNGELVTLIASGPGVFTNAIPTATGAAAVDNLLQISHGDLISANYRDESEGVDRSAVVLADLVPPFLTTVSATNQFGGVVISWTTDEDATSMVHYGTNSSLTLAEGSVVLEQSHEVALADLIEGATYQFLVTSVDEAGNASTNNNSGALFSFVVQPARTVLLVNAYNPADPLFNTVEIPLAAYTSALDQTGVSYDVWDVLQRGPPGTNDLRPFKVVIWRLNDNPLSDDTIDAPQQVALQRYVDSGGSLFLSSMEILTRPGISDAFRSNVLHVASFVTDAGVPSVDGSANDVISGGLNLPLDYTDYDSEILQLIMQSPDVSDTLSLTTNAVPIFVDSGSADIAGLRYPRTGQDNDGRVVFLAFPFDAVSETAPAPDNRANLLRNVLGFLAPGANGLGTISLDRSAYTLPALVTVEVGDSDLAGQGQASVTFFSYSDTNGVPVSLAETPRPGLFRGFVTLVGATNPPALGRLRAAHGEAINVEYFDASASAVVRAAADVDTIPCAIANVTVVPDYESAEVSWDLSELADALVQFGESPFLERTAYDLALAEGHSLTLTGLRPDRVYFFQVVSRDAAGNTTVDDNGGQLYTFRTLKPISPPWTDSLETGATNWTVFDAEETQVSWQLGPPNNGWETAAQSPPNAWGSNLNGDTIDVAESFLISPAIDLTGGNVASLRFWHSYDFTDENAILDGGELLLITNNVVVPLVAFVGDGISWTEESIDLTPYVGHVVILVWHYVYFSFEPSPTPGWLLDDVSVTVSSAERGTVIVTNNLAQARFDLSGPLSQSGQGSSLTLTNVPLGQYVVTFNPVPYYQTPAPQTNLASSATPIVFQGIYTFTDANTNGMSDAWEQQVFGSVSSNRTQVTDTDGDGQTDYAEFAAGTDATNPASALEVSTPTPQTGGSLRFEWASVPGREYRLVASGDLISWSPVTGWLRATGPTTSVLILPSDDPGAFYRVEARP